MAQSLSYSQHLLSNDVQVVGRVSSILKDEGYVPVGQDATSPAWKYMADVAAQPGLAESYHTALLNKVENPGAADDVITDGVLLSAVATVIVQASEGELSGQSDGT